MWPGVHTFFRALREAQDTQDAKVGAVGFCVSGRDSIFLAQDDEALRTKCGRRLADRVFVGHPSAIALPKELVPVKIPLSIAISDRDAVGKVDVASAMKELL